MMKYIDFFKKMSGKNIIYLLITVSVLLLIFSGGTNKSEKNCKVAESDNDYYQETSVRLEEILGKIRGAGKVSVMFVFENKGEVVPVFNIKTNMDEENKKNETESTAVLFGQGSNEQPYITEEKTPQISGIIIVAEGAENENVKIEIFEAVRALLGVPAHRIKVSAGNK